MNIFAEIDGLGGEDLVTAILRFLLLRSYEVRQSFIRLISSVSPVGPIALRSHFSCLWQPTTEDKKSKRFGRLDLLIETDDTILGIENKIYASFQEGQPHKYLDTVRQYADDLKPLRRSKEFRHFVAVIAPNSRAQEVHQRIQGQEHLVFIPWEYVLKEFRSVASSLDPMANSILTSFIGYIEEKIAFLPDFEQWVPHLKRRFDDGGSASQRDVVARLWHFFPDAGPRLSKGRTWCGYYFCSTSKDHTGWYGYVHSDEIKQGAVYGAELIIATSFDLSSPTKIFWAKTYPFTPGQSTIMKTGANPRDGAKHSNRSIGRSMSCLADFPDNRSRRSSPCIQSVAGSIIPSTFSGVQVTHRALCSLSTNNLYLVQRDETAPL